VAKPNYQYEKRSKELAKKKKKEEKLKRKQERGGADEPDETVAQNQAPTGEGTASA